MVNFKRKTGGQFGAENPLKGTPFFVVNLQRNQVVNLSGFSRILLSKGLTGNYWSSTQNSSVNSWYLTFRINASYMVYHYRSDGLSVRCILGCDVPAIPAVGTHVPSETQIVWNWTAVPAADGYRFNTVNDYNTAVNLGAVTFATDAGLICSTAYTRYLWAYNECGNSASVMLTQSTLSCPWVCGAPLPITHSAAGGVAPEDKSTSYGTIDNVPGEPTKCWITNNLGSSRQALAVIDTTEASAGWYWQFNRLQGYKHSGLSRIPNTAWITSIDESTDWTRINDPCYRELGVGWRLPTQTEWNNVDVAGPWTNYNGAYGSLLKLHTAGALYYNSGVLIFRGTNGLYWSSSQYDNTHGWSITFNSGDCSLNPNYVKVSGNSIRCLLSCDLPLQPSSGTHVPSETQIVWNWTAIASSLGYKWNTVDDYNTAVDLGAVTFGTDAGLICNTAYTRYVWSYNECGNSASVILAQSTSICPWFCGDLLPITHLAAGGVAPEDKSTSYGTIDNVPGEPTKCWITRNLGSSHQANAFTDTTEASAGWYWQFNRMQGYKHSGLSRIPNTAWITSINESTDWTRINDPCYRELGIGWRLPTKTEWNNVDVAVPFSSGNAAFGSVLHLHATGYLGDGNGLLADRGLLGNYWSSTQQSATGAWYLGFDAGSCYMYYSFSKAYGFPVRCLLSCDLPPQPASGTHVPSGTQIVWNWTAVATSLGYKWNTVDDYNSATDLLTATTFTETGLICNTTYMRYIWSYNECGHSVSVTLTQYLSSCPWACGQPLNINHVEGNIAPEDKSTSYGTKDNVPGEPTKCWITSNLGSSRQALAVNDTTEASAGWYWQFNRMQGYKHSGLSRIPNTAWITSIDESTDWTRINDPCYRELPVGWRLPTQTEWNNVDVAGPWTNYNGAYGSLLKLHTAGALYYNSGVLNFRGTNGLYWSSSQYDNTHGWSITFNSGDCSLNPYYYKVNGNSIRCLLSCDLPSQPTSGTHVPTETQIVWNWTAVATSLGYKWNTVDDYNSAVDLGAVTFGTDAGLICNTAYTRYVWSYNECGNSASVMLTQSTLSCPGAYGTINCSNPVIVGDYVTGVALTATNTVTLDVNVLGTGPYTISTNTVNNYSFSGTGTFTTTGPQTVTLTGNGTPTAFETDILTVTFGSSNCTFNVIIELGHILCGTIYTYNEVYNTATGMTWLDRNLGAAQVATSSTDYLAYGALFQWGRLPDDHECVTWTSSTTGTPVNGTTPVQSTTDVPGHSLFIVSYSPPYDWRNPGNGNLWQGISGTNNPCPTGYRIPTITELENEMYSWSSPDAAGAFGSPLKFVTAGMRKSNGGALWLTGTNGYVWSSTSGGNSSVALFFSGNAGQTNNSRANGSSVRCVKD